MNNTKVTNILLIILVVFNLAFLGKWWMGHGKQPHHPGPKPMEQQTLNLLHDRNNGEMFLVKTLDFDTIQQKKLNSILEAHYAFFDKYMDAYIKTQSEFFNAFKNTPDSVAAYRCADSLGKLKAAMSRELYMHFISIKNICNQQQQQQYNQLIDNMSNEFLQLHRHDQPGASKAPQDSLK